MTSLKRKAWVLDQIAKSDFFHQKLHLWGLVEIATAIEQIKGETLDWNLEQLQISDKAWKKVIHRGIKPIVVFAHPDVLITTVRSVSYYRMMAMVSQKSMNQIGLSTTRFEQNDIFPSPDKALAIAQRLNLIISNLIEADEKINVREFDLWRGMAAGSQAQGSWQNAKGDKAELIIKGRLLFRLQEQGLISDTIDFDPNLRLLEIDLDDGRKVVFGDEPDVAIYRLDQIESAVEVKGGIDTAGVLERVGAAIKSLSRAKQENPQSTTILILQGVSVTDQAVSDIESHRNSVSQWFTIEDLLEDAEKREAFFLLLRI